MPALLCLLAAFRMSRRHTEQPVGACRELDEDADDWVDDNDPGYFVVSLSAAEFHLFYEKASLSVYKEALQTQFDEAATLQAYGDKGSDRESLVGGDGDGNNRSLAGGQQHPEQHVPSVEGGEQEHADRMRWIGEVGTGIARDRLHEHQSTRVGNDVPISDPSSVCLTGISDDAINVVVNSAVEIAMHSMQSDGTGSGPDCIEGVQTTRSLLEAVPPPFSDVPPPQAPPFPPPLPLTPDNSGSTDHGSGRSSLPAHQAVALPEDPAAIVLIPPAVEDAELAAADESLALAAADASLETTATAANISSETGDAALSESKSMEPRARTLADFVGDNLATSEAPRFGPREALPPKAPQQDMPGPRAGEAEAGSGSGSGSGLEPVHGGEAEPHEELREKLGDEIRRSLASFDLRVFYRPMHTGFEENKDFQAVPDTIIAGR